MTVIALIILWSIVIVGVLALSATLIYIGTQIKMWFFVFIGVIGIVAALTFAGLVPEYINESYQQAEINSCKGK